MTKIYLPNKVSLEDAITRLDLENMPFIRALKTLLMYSNKLGLSIHFNHEIYGYETSNKLDEIIADDGSISKLMVSEDATLIDASKDLRVSSAIGCFLDSGSYYISINSFHYDEDNFYTADETQMWLESQSLMLNCFYILKKDLLDFVNLMENNNVDNQQKLTTIPNANAPSALKALAIVAREYAEKGKKFQIGNNVNASAFKDYIIDNAKKYDVSTHGLKSIDDKINPMLIKLDINEINK